MTEDKHSFTIDSMVISYRRDPWRKNPSSYEEIDRKIKDLIRNDPTLPMRGFLMGLLGIQDMTVEKVSSTALGMPSANLNESPWDDFLDFLNGGASEKDAQQWLVRNLSRFNEEEQKAVLFGFYERASKERDGVSTAEDMTFEEFKKECREMKRSLGKNTQRAD